MARTLGIDVSHWQYPIDWSKVPPAVRFVIAKLSQALKISKECGDGFRGARSSGRIVGGYHLVDFESDTEKQVDTFLDVARMVGLGAGDLPPFLDVEKKKIKAVGGKLATEWIVQWCERVEDRTGVKPAIYISPRGIYHLVHGAGEDRVAELARWHLWIADYTEDDPVNPDLSEMPWNSWLLWQYTSSGPGKTWGMSSNGLDLNLFNGSVADLEAFCTVQRWRASRTAWIARLLRLVRRFP